MSLILRNEIYCGRGSWGEVRYEAPQIVTPDLWRACAHKRRENLVLASRNARRLYLLRNLVKCGRCRRNYNGTGSRGRIIYYQCNSQMHGRRPEHCGNKSVRAIELEEAVWRRAVRFLRDPGEALRGVRAAYRLLGESGDAEARSEIERRIERAAGEGARLVTMRRKGQIDEAEFLRERESLRAEVASLEAERERLAERRKAESKARSLEGRLGDLGERAERLEGAERRDILKEFVRGITVNSEGRVVKALAVFSIPSSNDRAWATPFLLGVSEEFTFLAHH